MGQLTDAEKAFLRTAERLDARVWRLVAKDQGCTEREYRTVPYHIRMIDLQGTLDRIAKTNDENPN